MSEPFRISRRSMAFVFFGRFWVDVHELAVGRGAPAVKKRHEPAAADRYR